MALCPGLLGLAGTRKVNQCGFTGARDSKWQWYQLGHMQIFTTPQTDNHASTPILSFFAGQMSFLLLKQQHKSTEGMCKKHLEIMLNLQWEDSK